MGNSSKKNADVPLPHLISRGYHFLDAFGSNQIPWECYVFGVLDHKSKLDFGRLNRMDDSDSSLSLKRKLPSYGGFRQVIGVPLVIIHL